jgi:hypothetical protein
MTEIGEVSVRKRRSRQEIKQLVAEFETSGLRRSEFCHKHNLALGTLQRGLRRRRVEVAGQSEGKRLVEVKVAGIQGNGSGAGTCPVAKALSMIRAGSGADCTGRWALASELEVNDLFRAGEGRFVGDGNPFPVD